MSLAFADLAEEPEQHYDRGVIVGGTAAQVVELSTFAVTTQQLVSDEELLVGLAALVARGVLVVAGRSGTNLTYLQFVQVCGTFDEFDPSSFAEKLGAALDEGSRTYRYGRRELLAQ